MNKLRGLFPLWLGRAWGFFGRGGFSAVLLCSALVSAWLPLAGSPCGRLPRPIKVYATSTLCYLHEWLACCLLAKRKINCHTWFTVSRLARFKFSTVPSLPSGPFGSFCVLLVLRRFVVCQPSIIPVLRTDLMRGWFNAVIQVVAVAFLVPPSPLCSLCSGVNKLLGLFPWWLGRAWCFVGPGCCSVVLLRSALVLAWLPVAGSPRGRSPRPIKVYATSTF